LKRCLIFLLMFAATTTSAGAMTVGGAHADFGFSCADCHKTDTPEKAPNNTDCLSCHGSYEELAAKTKPTDIADPTDKEAFANPHESHMGPIPCMDCHKTHRKSELICADCHNFDWLPK